MAMAYNESILFVCSVWRSTSQLLLPMLSLSYHVINNFSKQFTTVATAIANLTIITKYTAKHLVVQLNELSAHLLEIQIKVGHIR